MHGVEVPLWHGGRDSCSQVLCVHVRVTEDNRSCHSAAVIPVIVLATEREAGRVYIGMCECSGEGGLCVY